MQSVAGDSERIETHVGICNLALMNIRCQSRKTWASFLRRSWRAQRSATQSSDCKVELELAASKSWRHKRGKIRPELTFPLTDTVPL